MRHFLTLLILLSLSSAPLLGQTRLDFCFFADTYNPDPVQGLWYALPDLGTYSRLNGYEGYEEIAADPRDNSNYYLTKNRFQDQFIERGTSVWSLPTLRLSGFGEGRDGYLYAGAIGAKFYRLDFSTQTYTLLATGGATFTDLAADVDGALYGVAGNQLFQVDTATGTQTLAVTLARPIHGIGISHDGRFWGIESINMGFSYCRNRLYQLDPVSGNTRFVMDLPNSVSSNYAGMSSETGPPQPMNSVLLSGPATANPGSSAAFNLSAAPVGSLFALLASTSLGASFIGGQPFELAVPQYRVALGRTDVLGAATTSFVVPGVLSGRTIYLEAGVREQGSAPTRIYDSNVHTVVVL